MVKIRFRLLANRVIWGLLSLALVVAMLGKSHATQIGAQGLGPDRIFAVTRNSDSVKYPICEDKCLRRFGQHKWLAAF